MYGDTMVMRRRAAQLREQGEDIRAMAEQLVSRSDEVDWTGRAADAMRARVRDRAAHLREAAAAHDTAAASLEQHLGECDRLGEAIRAIERRASSLVADSREDQALASFTPPPAGHKDWLGVELPGL
jgi:chromosome segregation ATPase